MSNMVLEYPSAVEEKKEKFTQDNPRTYKGRANASTGSVRALAEAVILQSMEDFWSNTYKQESVEFFKGEGFNICAKIAGLGKEEQMKVLQMLAGEPIKA